LNEYLTTRELAELLRIKERKVYDLASSGSVPCSRATGKLLFPREAIEKWIAGNASSHAVSRPTVMLGSHDPLLEWAIRESRCGIASYFDSSLDGLNRFAAGEGIATGLHVFDTATDDWNRPLIETKFSSQAAVLVAWAKRQRGIIINRDEQSINQLSDLRSHKVIPRQSEAGSQVVLNAFLVRDNIASSDIEWLTPARSEVDAVLAVQEGKADATFGLASLAAQYNLGFVPVVEERFDLFIDRRAWFEPAWQTLYQFCQSSALKQRADELIGYQINEQFKIIYNSVN